MAIVVEHGEDSEGRKTPGKSSMLKYIAEIRVFSIFAICTFGAAQAIALAGTRFQHIVEDPLAVILIGSVVGAIAVAIVKWLHLIR